MEPVNFIHGLFPEKAASWKPGRLVCSIELEPQAAEAVRRFVAFGGEGWLCASDSPDIRRFSAGKPPALAPGAFPLCGEATIGPESLHLHRTAAGWELVTLRRDPPDGEGQLLRESALLARDAQGKLRYETAWRLENSDGLEEIRPYAYRFIGFSAEV